MSDRTQSAPLPPSVVAEFFGWWMAELRVWFAGLARSNPERSQIAPADLTICRCGLVAGVAGQVFPADQALDALQSLHLPWRLGSKGLHLQLEADRYVIRQLTGGRIPLSRAYRMAELDVAANTPFIPDDVYILFSSDGAASGGTDYIVLRRDVIDPVLEAIKASRHRLGRITLRDDPAPRQVQSYAVEAFNGDASRLLRLLRQRFFIFGFCMALGLLLWNLFAALDRGTAEVTDQIATVEPTAQAARLAFKKRSEHISRLQAFYKDRKDYTPAAKILEELTRIIPDDTFLMDFVLRNRKVQLSGFSTSAASLISIVDSSPLFKNPKFTTAVVKVPDRKGEQFSMELELEAVDNDG